MKAGDTRNREQWCDQAEQQDESAGIHKAAANASSVLTMRSLENSDSSTVA